MGRVGDRVRRSLPAGGGKVRGDRPIGGNPFAGFMKVLTSPYLLAIALFVVFIGTINTLLYFEQMRLVEAAFANTADRTRIFARLDWIVQSLTVVCQVFLTGRIASKLGLTTLLIIVPIFMIGGFLTLAATGTLTVLLVVFVARRVGEYAFVRPAREMLFSRVDNETKYKAKNVIDVPVYRGADALSAQVKTAIESAGSTPAHVAVLGAVLAAAWAINGWYLGRSADEGVRIRKLLPKLRLRPQCPLNSARSEGLASAQPSACIARDLQCAQSLLPHSKNAARGIWRAACRAIPGDARSAPAASAAARSRAAAEPRSLTYRRTVFYLSAFRRR